MPSQEIMDAVCDAGGLVVVCDFCGTTHFGDAGDYNAGELEEYRRRAEAGERYSERAGFSSHGLIDGRIYVYDCCEEGAKYLDRVEQWLLSHTLMLENYFTARAVRLRQLAESADRISEAAK